MRRIKFFVKMKIMLREGMEIHEKWMRHCLRLALKAQSRGEVPVGACLVSPYDGLISSAYNLRETKQFALGHAEIIAIHLANKKRNSWRLEDCTLYVTLEPCVMCAGAILQSRIQNLVFGARDPKAGAVCSLHQLCQNPNHNHQVNVIEGILEKDCSQIISAFFQDLRKLKKQQKISQ